MLLAKIVSSNSHIDYVARVVDEFDADQAPAPGECGFGTFVSMRIKNGPEIIGAVYNSVLVNPEFASFGPRLSSRPELENFSPDLLNEQGLLVGILLLGTFEDGVAVQGVPKQAVQAGESVFDLESGKFLSFHRSSGEGMSFHYFPQIISQAGAFAIPLLESIIARLSAEADGPDLKRLAVLRESLSWQRTIGGMRL